MSRKNMSQAIIQDRFLYENCPGSNVRNPRNNRIQDSNIDTKNAGFVNVSPFNILGIHVSFGGVATLQLGSR